MVALACGAAVAVDAVGPGFAVVDEVVGPVARSPNWGAPLPALGQTAWYQFWMVDMSAAEHKGQTP